MTKYYTCHGVHFLMRNHQFVDLHGVYLWYSKDSLLADLQANGFTIDQNDNVVNMTIVQHVETKLKELGFKHNEYLHKYGISPNKDTYIMAFFDEKNNRYIIKGESKGDSPSNRQIIYHSFDNETAFFNKIQEYLSQGNNNVAHTTQDTSIGQVIQKKAEEPQQVESIEDYTITLNDGSVVLKPKENNFFTENVLYSTNDGYPIFQKGYLYDSIDHRVLDEWDMRYNSAPYSPYDKKLYKKNIDTFLNSKENFDKLWSNEFEIVVEDTKTNDTYLIKKSILWKMANVYNFPIKKLYNEDWLRSNSIYQILDISSPYFQFGTDPKPFVEYNFVLYKQNKENYQFLALIYANREKEGFYHKIVNDKNIKNLLKLIPNYDTDQTKVFVVYKSKDGRHIVKNELTKKTKKG
jgi:hypothetical protein